MYRCGKILLWIGFGFLIVAALAIITNVILLTTEGIVWWPVGFIKILLPPAITCLVLGVILSGIACARKNCQR